MSRNVEGATRPRMAVLALRMRTPVRSQGVRPPFLAKHGVVLSETLSIRGPPLV